MGSVKRGPRRGLSLAVSADWCAEDLPAAIQGGARRAIFRGLYKGAEPAARRSGSESARHGEGLGYTRAGSQDARAGRLGPSTGLRPSPSCLRPLEGRGSRAAVTA